jgi:hypothetical protein
MGTFVRLERLEGPLYRCYYSTDMFLLSASRNLCCHDWKVSNDIGTAREVGVEWHKAEKIDLAHLFDWKYDSASAACTGNTFCCARSMALLSSACVASYWPVSLIISLLLTRLWYASDWLRGCSISKQNLLLLYSISASE